MASEVSASLLPVNPSTLFFDGYELADQSIIPNENVVSAFVPYEDKVEFWIYDLNKNLIDGDEDFVDYSLVQSPSSDDSKNDTTEVELSPIEDAYNLGYDTGKLYTVYNFVRYHLASTPQNRYYLAEISSDRTEIRLKSNIITDEEIANSFAQFKNELDSSEYFDEFYISFGENQYNVGVNLELDITGDTNSILIKLYDALPPDFVLKDELFIATKVAESVGYQIEYPNIIDLPSDVTFLKGPNTNLDIKDFINNSTELKSRNELVNTQSTSSKDNLENILNRKGVTITPNYSYNTFNEFVNFSSAKKRIENFIEKVEQIQAYESDISVLTTITGSTSASFEVSSSIASAETNIENLIKNFDGYEYFLYYNTGSSAYPKTGSAFPYTLLPTTDSTVTQWLGSDVEGSQNYGGILLSASFYDNRNQNWLYYTIPEFLRDNDSNNQYVEFSNMVGQHFDEIWLYTKAVSQRNNTTSDLDGGLPLQLADDAISSLGYKGFGNNYNNEDNFIGLTGEDNGSYVPPTGSELINHYIAVNGGSVVNYWSDYYSYQFYVESIEDPGWPYAIDRVSKEIFKRLYHNMSYLVKKKGTISGLRQLINIWGIPNTILRINEFGGKNKDDSDDYDLWYNRYSYAFSPISTQHMPSASVVFPWMPLERNRIADGEYIVPDSFQFRFKTTGIPTSSFAGSFTTQSLAVKKSDGDDTSTDFDFGIALFYTGSTSGSYLGSSSSEYEDWGVMRFYISGSTADGGVAMSDDVYLPFYNKGWWSVMLQRDTHVSASDNSNATTYTLYVKNKTYNGWDGNSIGFEGSASIISDVSSSINEAWNKFGTGSADGIYLGGFVSGSNVGGVTLNEPGKMLSGSLQEFRYYSQPLPELKFNDFVMNPESIEGINLTGSLSSFDILNFRAPLGNEMESIFTASLSSSYSEPMTSLHPAITGSANILITGSFVNPVGDVTSSIYNVLYYENSTTKTFSKTNTEVYFLDQPAIGLRNRINNKIQIEDGSDYGTTLSSIISIEQDYQISRSYTEDVNSLEVAFSPQEEINDDIIATFGYGVVADALADPRFISESLDYYPQLRRTAEDYFQKYTKGNVYDYLRLIKYFDNSIFKAIKNYVPARTNVTTGIVIKQHLLERNRYPQPKLNEVTTIARYASGSGANITYNNPINLENLELTSSLSISNITGSTGGSVNKFNYSGSPDFGQIPVTQSWIDNRITSLGVVSEVEDSQKEFYDGEYSGSKVIATTQSLFNNLYNPPTYLFTEYDVQSTIEFNKTGSCEFNIYTSANPVAAQKALNNYQPSGPGENAISLFTPAPGIYYVAAIAIQNNYPFYTGTFPGLVGDPGFTNPYPSTTPPFNYPLNQVSPYFQFSIDGAESSGTFNSDPKFGGVSFGEIYSSALEVTYDQINQYGIRVQQYKQNTNSRRIEGSSLVINNGTNITVTLLLGNFNYIKQNMLDDYFSNPAQGEGNVYYYPLEFSQSAANNVPSSGKWAPVGLAINKFDSSQNDLSSAFKLLPDVKFTAGYSGTPLSVDSYKLKGNEVDTSYLKVESYASTKDHYGVVFNPISSDLGRINSGSATFKLANTSSLVLFDPFIPEVEGVNNFENSDYFANLNNYNDNRDNSFVMNLEYNNGISTPSNISLVKNRTAEKTETPDSNYTTKRVTRPRYEGVKLQSADYNFYTAGDVSYGKTAAIDKNPIYFAHFKSSKENYELWDSYTFRIDSLIQVPFGDVRGDAIEPVTLKIDGSNDRLAEVVSTFEKGRGATVSYNIGKTDNIDYTSLKIGSSDIFQGGLEYNLIQSTEKGKEVSNYVTTQSFVSSSWLTFGFTRTGSALTQSNEVTLTTYGGLFGTGGENYWAETGSGVIILKGGGFGVTGSTGGSNPEIMSLWGPGLGVIHSMNKAVEYQLTASNQSLFNPNVYNPGIPRNSNIDPNISTNYWSLSPTGSGLYGYEDFQQPFLIKRGDEIRVTWEKRTGFTGDPQTVDFTVTNTPHAPSNGGYSYFQGLGVGTVNSRSIYDHIEVTPDPTTYNIPNGEIYNMTIRRRIEADDRVIVFQTPPSGSQGINTITKDGYLIPNDLTPTQKRNVQTLINQLKNKNAFTDDNPPTTT